MLQHRSLCGPPFQQRRWQDLARRPSPSCAASAGERSAPTAEDRQYMMRALQLASRALGQTFPNPAVGCVIVKDGEVRARRAIGRRGAWPSVRPP